MNTTEKEKFESLWVDFIALVKGKLIGAAAKQRLSTPLANLILSDAASSWGSEYEINGRWLNGLNGTDQKKAVLVSEVLLKDMHFSELEKKGELPDFYNYVIPTVGACAGFAISYHLGCGKLVQAASTIIPAALLYPAVKTFRKRTTAANTERTIEVYIKQLEKYKNSILSILG